MLCDRDRAPPGIQQEENAECSAISAPLHAKTGRTARTITFTTSNGRNAILLGTHRRRRWRWGEATQPPNYDSDDQQPCKDAEYDAHDGASGEVLPVRLSGEFAVCVTALSEGTLQPVPSPPARTRNLYTVPAINPVIVHSVWGPSHSSTLNQVVPPSLDACTLYAPTNQDCSERPVSSPPPVST